jgi:CheY-like chemotaxis protein
MDGLGAARRIREHPATCFIPILALTARSLFDDRKRHLQDGCEDCIYQPFANTLLVSRVERLLE